MTENEQTGHLGVIVEKDVATPMRDGITLSSNVFRPDAPGKFPCLLLRTPYGKPEEGFQRFVRAGYVVVTQDSRGRYESEGEWIPISSENTGDAEDGYDAVEWLARQPYSNSKVGTIGGSYGGWMQWELARLRPPSLVAMCARTIPLEIQEVDWPGAFKPGRRVKWWMTSMAPDLRKRHDLPGAKTKEEALKIWDEVEQGKWLGFLPWGDLPRHLPKGLAEHAEEWFKNPARRVWGFAEKHQDVAVPNLDFTGWYDHCNGTIGHLGGMQKNGATEVARTQTRLVIGPWNHGQVGARKLGEIDFGPQALLDLSDLTIRWFDYWLKGLDNGIDREPAVRYFVVGAEKWRNADAWPPDRAEEKTLFLSANVLAPEAPEDDPPETYLYDPNDPVPTLWTPELFTVPSDRRALEYREDILRYRTPQLEEEIEIAGNPRVVLHAASSAPDTDFFARLVDENPEGAALEICYGMVRARHRNSLEREEFIAPGEVVEFEIQLGPTACCFQKGHCIRLEITSSDFPNHDRNHNTGRNDLFDTELRPARQEIHHSAQYPSRLILPTM